MKKITIYYPDNAPAPSLELLQAAVGGLIEAVDRYHPNAIGASEDRGEPTTAPAVVAYANEEGAYVCAPATAPPAALEAIHWPDYAGPIFGPVVVCEGWPRGVFTDEIDDDGGEA